MNNSDIYIFAIQKKKMKQVKSAITKAGLPY